jgi:hypothetical protein
MDREVIGHTYDLFGRLTVVACGNGVHLENTSKTMEHNLHPDCARELAALLVRAAAVPGPIRNGTFDTRTSPPIRQHRNSRFAPLPPHRPS